MRFKVYLQPETKEISLPYNYNYHLSSAIYSFLDKAEPAFSDFLHDYGFSSDRKSFKLFTFSPLLASNRRPLSDQLILKGKINWFISSPKEVFLSNLVTGILGQGFLPTLGHKLIVESVEVMAQPSLEGKTFFRTLSPVVVSTGETNPEGKFTKKYLSPADAKFYQVLEDNLRRKYKACYGKEPPEEGVTIQFDSQDLSRGYISKLIDFKGIKIRGWMGRFIAEGNPELIRLGYEAGFGEGNSAGFGMVEVRQ
jgi:CRISPR-associated endoribonuclease Cas6